MEIDDLLSNGYVRRWSLVDGQARCVEDALPSTSSDALPTLQRNAAIRTIIGEVEAYEAAQTVVARGEPDNGQPREVPNSETVRPEDAPEDWTPPLIANPDWALLPRTVETTGAEGQTQTAPDPRWQAYDDAQAEIATATDLTKALARWRAAEAGHGAREESVAEDDVEAEGAPWEADRAAVLAALATEAAKPLAHDPRPIPATVSRRQFALACATLALMSPQEAMAFVTTNATPAILSAAIARLPQNQQFAVTLTVAGSMVFDRENPATIALMDLATLPPAYASPQALRDAIWRLGSTFP